LLIVFWRGQSHVSLGVDGVWNHIMCATSN
jgi:hypothetical protein